MKVYYNIAPLPPFDISGLLGNEEIENSLMKTMNELMDKFHVDLALKWKYRILWELRGLEKEISESEGMIIIEEKGFHTKNFTRELTDKIMSILKSFDENKW